MFIYDRLALNTGSGASRETSDLLADHSIELEIVRGHARRRRRPVCVPAYLIGRADDCDLVVGDDRFPHAYAYLLVRGKQLLLRHLGFAPELRVNGVPVTQLPLGDGDSIQAGPYEFRVHIRHFDAAAVSGAAPFAGGIRPATARAVAQTEALAEALDLIRCIREEVLGDRSSFRLFLGPEGHLANLSVMATLPVDSEAFRGPGSQEARSA
jgi:hypothetical protein